jgi:peptide/nickel transport system substrate-binding protein
MCTVSMPAMRTRAQLKDLNPSIGHATVENNTRRRLKLLKQFQDTVARDVPDLNLYQPVLTIANQRVHDHSLTADGVVADVWMDAAKK